MFQLMHVMGLLRDAYVYHYLFNRSRLVVVVHVLFTTQQRLQYQLPKASPQ